ncbi:MAG: hypothetical protein LBU36_07990 [Clostridiales bacterium]|nr:hypothetical protein [Clostridiales bacterium]
MKNLLGEEAVFPTFAETDLLWDGHVPTDEEWATQPLTSENLNDVLSGALLDTTEPLVMRRDEVLIE